MYGFRPKTWFLLSRHSRSDTLLQEIRSMPFDESPGNNIGQFLFFLFPLKTLMCRAVTTLAVSLSVGQALAFTEQYLLNPSAGRRPSVPGAVVIIADRRSADNLTLSANALRASGDGASLTLLSNAEIRLNVDRRHFCLLLTFYCIFVSFLMQFI